MSLTLKFTSLAIRTLSKPIANYIKRQAREHPGFRQTCIAFAQSLHRIDMRWRIGLLQDSAALEKQAARDAAKREAERKKAQTPTVKTEAETKAEAEADAKEKTDEEKDKNPPPKPRIKPLSETKAIESGANFISETFLFTVAAGLIMFESWRSNRKARNRRDQVAEQLSDLEEENKAARAALIELEREVLRLRAKEKGISMAELSKTHRLLPDQVYELAKEDNQVSDLPQPTPGLFSSLKRVFSRDGVLSDQQAQQAQETQEAQEALATNLPGPAEKMLVEADRALEEKRRRREEEKEKEEAQRETSILKKMSTGISNSSHSSTTTTTTTSTSKSPPSQSS